jgi:hypothetical protein
MELRAISFICIILWRKAFCTTHVREMASKYVVRITHLLVPVLETLFTFLVALAAVNQEQPNQSDEHA